MSTTECLIWCICFTRTLSELDRNVKNPLLMWNVEAWFQLVAMLAMLPFSIFHTQDVASAKYIYSCVCQKQMSMVWVKMTNYSILCGAIINSFNTRSTIWDLISCLKLWCGMVIQCVGAFHIYHWISHWLGTCSISSFFINQSLLVTNQTHKKYFHNIWLGIRDSLLPKLFQIAAIAKACKYSVICKFIELLSN